MGKLIIEAAAILNEDNEEFFAELMKKGVDAIKPEMNKQLKEMKKKKLTDDDGITYEEVNYKTYLASGNKHRIVKSLNSRYFVEVDDAFSQSSEVKGE